MKLSKAALNAMAAEEAAFPKARDALDRLAFLTGPILSETASNTITCSIASEVVEKNFGLKLTEEVTTALLSRAAAHGFLLSTRVEDGYVYTPQKNKTYNKTSTLDQLILDFRKFISDRELLPTISDDEILNLFLEKVFELDDFFDEKTNTARASVGDRWKYTLISDYIITKSSGDGELPPLLARLAEICLMRFLVGQMTEKKIRQNNSKLQVLLDAPVALRAIGASGKLQQESALATLGAAKRAGVRFAIFPTSVEEMKRVLKGVLNEDHRNRRGLTATAIRRGDVIEQVIDDMSKNPAKYLKSRNITILPRDLDAFPDSVKYFPAECFREFAAFASRWAERVEGQDHDAELLALVARARRGEHDTNLLMNTYTAVTYNWTFARESKKYCLEKFFISDSASPPVVHYNDFAASAWLATGFSLGERIPERTLLAACEKSLGDSGAVLKKTVEILEKLKTVDETYIELLLRDRDCILEISRQTGNDTSIVNETNVGILLQKAREAAASEVKSAYDDRLSRLKSEHDDQLLKVESEYGEQISELKAALDDFKAKVDSATGERERQIAALEEKYRAQELARRKSVADRVIRYNRYMSRRGLRLLERIGFVVMTVASIAACFQFSVMAGAAIFAIGLVYSVMAWRDMWLPSRINRAILSRHAVKKLNKDFSQSEQSEWQLQLSNDFELEMRA